MFWYELGKRFDRSQVIPEISEKSGQSSMICKSLKISLVNKISITRPELSFSNIYYKVVLLETLEKISQMTETLS